MTATPGSEPGLIVWDCDGVLVDSEAIVIEIEGLRSDPISMIPRVSGRPAAAVRYRSVSRIEMGCTSFRIHFGAIIAGRRSVR